MRALTKFLLFLLALGCLTLPQQVFATEMTITDNGSGSSSQTSVSSQNSSTVSQTNTAAVTNEISSQSNSGNNSISNSTGPAEIQTGNSTTQTSVENTANSNTTINEQQPCCQNASTSAAITGNGSQSTNSITATSSATQLVSSTNSGTIVNTIHTSSSTGGNSIQNVSGNATIQTGNAKSVTSVTTVANSNLIDDPGSSVKGNVSVSIKSNGENSNNAVSLTEVNPVTIVSQNNIQVINNIESSATTGDNTIRNVGGVISLSTGNASTLVHISNEVNTNKVVLSSCCTKAPEPNPCTDPCNAPSPTGGYNSSSSSTPSSGGTGGGGIGGGPSILGASEGFVLPATGSNLSMWATLFNVLMLLLGLYLRRTAGRSPSKR